jgi:Ca-activated chloride channel homolog
MPISMKITTRILSCLAAFATTGMISPPPANAAGLLIADGGLGGVLEIQEHDVKVTINNGIAVTHVTQVFRNTEKRQVEALYTFPVPKGASVANFSMWIGGREMVGEVLEKKRAREIYDSYKQKQRDPGLLEQTDYRTFEMRIFPIPAGAEQKVQVTYYQELDVDHDWATYIYPLATTTRGNADSRTHGRFAISLDVKSAIPITALESPSHDKAFAIARHSDGYYQASLETNGGSLAKDVVIAHHLSRPHTGIDVLTSASPQDDGFFSVMLTAGEDLAAKNAGADYVFVLDISGSMASDGKLLLSKDCLGAFVSELGPDDRFEVMTFNIQPRPAFNAKRAADAQAKADAAAFLGSAVANGGTVLNPAITTAYKYADPDRPLNVVILSDGLTEQNERRELLQLIASRPRNAKVFCIGVGNDVNRPLLEQLANDSGGLASFLSQEDNFARQAKAFRRKLMNPVATDLEMNFSGVEVYDVEPRKLPSLYHGSPIRIYGRYRGNGTAKLALRGNLNGVEWKQAADIAMPRTDATSPEIERMWAWHRIDSLLKETERTGARSQAVPEVVRLGEMFSIVTEYTSFLVLENDTEFQRWKIERRNQTRVTRDRESQSVRLAALDTIRKKAVADIGPEPAVAKEPMQMASAKPAVPVAAQPAPSTRPAPERVSRQSWDLNVGGGGRGGGGGGSGPVGPLFVAFAAWLAHRKQQITKS